jgi:hypothetical protein
MENRHRWEQPLSDKPDYDLDVVVETSLAMAQATIQKAMRESKIRNADLAERLDRPRSFISKMLSGSHNLTVKTLSRAMAACGYELTWQYQPIQWGWVKEPIVIDIDRSAVPAPAGIALSGYGCAA